MTRLLVLLPLLLTGCLYVTIEESREPVSRPAATTQASAVVDELFLPAGRPHPTTGRVVLVAGRVYDVTVDGTYSVYEVRQWRTVCAGRPEPAPRYPSGARTGPVGHDPSYVFAVPDRSSACDLPLVARHSGWYYRLTRLGDWRAGATDEPYRSDHTYSLRVVGEGAPFTAYVYDAAGGYADNYGGLRVVIRETAQ